MRRVIVAFAVAALAAGVVAPSAGAATKEAHGWWWRAQSGLLGAAIPPPGVPEDGLAVETLPDGPSAIAAVRYLLDKGESQPVLELKVADQQGEIAIQACMATQPWTSDHGGPWDERPTYDCGTAAEGKPSKDGARWQWELSALLKKGRLNVVLVPAPGSGRVTFEPPDDGSLKTTRASGGGAGSQNFDPPPVTAFTDPEPERGSAPPPPAYAPPPSTTTSAPASSQAEPFIPAPAGGTPAEPAQAPAFTAPEDSAAAQPPQAAQPLQPQAAQAAQPTPPPAAAVPTSSDSSRTTGSIIAAMAAVLALALWHQDTSGPRRARGAGSGATAQSFGGLGRFARARTGSPPPLL